MAAAFSGIAVGVLLERRKADVAQGDEVHS
jgi:hypothetical protein